MFSEDEIREKYADFLEHFGDNIERFCYVYSSSHNDAVDLMQEIILAIWVGLPKLAPDTTHRQANRWLYKLICLNFLTTYLLNYYSNYSDPNF